MNRPSLLIAIALLTLLIVFMPPSNKAWLYKWESLLEAGREPSKMRGTAGQEEHDQKSSEHDRSRLNSKLDNLKNERFALTVSACHVSSDPAWTI